VTWCGSGMMPAKIGDWTRFTGSSIASFVGLVPSEHSSGQSRSQGGVTKTGNSHARRLLVEAAWHHCSAHHRTQSIRLQARWAKADALIFGWPSSHDTDSVHQETRDSDYRQAVTGLHPFLDILLILNQCPAVSNPRVAD